MKISLHFQETEEQKKFSTITVLPYYQGGLQSNVFLGMNSKGTLSVVKQFCSEEEYEVERKIWSTIYKDIGTVSRIYHNVNSLEMPFIFTCTKTVKVKNFQ